MAFKGIKKQHKIINVKRTKPPQILNKLQFVTKNKSTKLTNEIMFKDVIIMNKISFKKIIKGKTFCLLQTDHITVGLFTKMR